MTVRELSELYYIKREIIMDEKRLADIDADIQREEEKLRELELSATSASGQNLDGMPKAQAVISPVERAATSLMDQIEIIRRKRALRQRIAQTITSKHALCVAEQARLEEYIAALPESLLRMIFTYRFVDCLAWGQVAENIGAGATEDSVKKACYRYLNKEHKI